MTVPVAAFFGGGGGVAIIVVAEAREVVVAVVADVRVLPVAVDGEGTVRIKAGGIMVWMYEEGTAVRMFPVPATIHVLLWLAACL